MKATATPTAAPTERAAQRSALIADTYFPPQLSYRDPGTFQGRLERRSTGRVSLSRLCTEPTCYKRVPGLIRQGEAGEYLVTIPSLVPVLFRQPGRDITCTPGGFIIGHGDEPYRFACQARNDLLVMKIARSALAERLCATFFDGRKGLGGLFAKTVHRAHAIPTDPAAAEVLGRHLIELLALDRHAEVDSGAATVIRAAHLKRAQDVVLRQLTDLSLAPETVAAACGIWKHDLHDLFGDIETTVVQFIREARLKAPRDAGGLSLALIAYRLGLSDQAQFSRLFRAMSGQTPSSCRTAFREGRRGSD
uniref:AraC-like ligand-binding domain-containing protein n=1 Tax=Paracoccus sp. TRP TaxID=412597 RepID=UPI000225F2D4|nr:helix-turn-helix domain-containing protein [Paracoccus sp. TRP]